MVDVNISTFTLNQVLDGSGAYVVNQQGKTASGNEVTHTTFSTIMGGDNQDVNIAEDLTQVIVKYYDDVSDISGSTNLVLKQIQEYAAQIKCSNFQGKGTIDDYTELFQAASQIANDSKQMTLSVDLSGFSEFGQAADDLSKLFTSFITKLESVNIINDLSFLQTIALALGKIVNLANVFGKFKETILATTTIEVPKSAHDAALLVNSVLNEVNCAMTYISHFVDGTSPAPSSADLSATEQLVISKAVATIENWNVLCEQDVTVSMSNSPDVIAVKAACSSFGAKTAGLRANTSTLRGKMATLNMNMPTTVASGNGNSGNGNSGNGNSGNGNSGNGNSGNGNSGNGNSGNGNSGAQSP